MASGRVCEYLPLVSAPLEELLAKSGALRAARFGNGVHVCAIINARSGNCPNNCAFCAQSRHHSSESKVYGLLENTRLLAEIEELRAIMPGNIGLVCSGSALGGRELERLCRFIADLCEGARARLCLSAGTLEKHALRELASAGLRHYHHNLESSEAFYPRICSSQKWRRRRRTVAEALALGFDVCSGGLFGMGESWEDRIALALELRELGVTNVPLNFLVPRPGTPLASRRPMPPEEALRIAAIFRIILPEAILRICGGRRECFCGIQERVFDAAANAMISGNYLTASGFAFEEDRRMLEACGMRLVENLP